MVSILIPARNAEATIARALQSVLSQTSAPIILADDHSTDRTVEVACDLAGSQLQVVRPDTRCTVAAVRQTALAATQTPLAVWLDADDELLPGRVDRLVSVLETDRCDFVWDAAEMANGKTGRVTSTSPIPGFLTAGPRPVRLFERNYLPAPGAPGVRVDTAQKFGFDPVFQAAEDIDLMLRVVEGGARIRLVAETGYRVYSYPGSLSRHLDHQRQWYRRALAKHRYERIRTLYAEAGCSDMVTAWAIVSVALFRQDVTEARRALAEVRRVGADSETVLEPDGPCPWSERWRQAFAAGTIALLSGDPAKAVSWLEQADATRESAEALNNLGVAHARLGRPHAASSCFERALGCRPGYADARLNLETSPTVRITTHPFRREGSDYSPRMVARGLEASGADASAA